MAERYVRPSVIPNDMGDDTFDMRLREVKFLLNYMPEEIHTVLDVGMGKGQISEYLTDKGYNVTGTGLEVESYGIDVVAWEAKGIKVVSCPVEHMPFADCTFDAVVASHILEHCHNYGNALKEIRRVLKKDGFLLLFVPPYATMVLAGHVSTGWNLGQLVYVLLLNGFNVKQGQFIHYGSSLCAFVSKDEHPLPPLRGDRGDIHILHEAGLFPFTIAEARKSHDAFEGRRIVSVNWDDAEDIIKKHNEEIFSSYSCLRRIIIYICRLFVFIMGAANATKVGEILLSLSENQYNPQNVSV